MSTGATGEGEPGPGSAADDDPDEAKSPDTTITDETLDAAATAYYQWVMTRAESARQRAQVAFTMVSFVAGAIVAAGLFGDIENEPDGVKVLGIGALAAWLATAGMLLNAAVGPWYSQDKKRRQSIVGRRNFLQYVIERQESERNLTYKRLGPALVTAFLAMVLTASTIGAAVESSPGTVNGEFRLTDAGVKALPARCQSNAVPTLAGAFHEDAIDAKFVEIEVASSECAGSLARRPPTVEMRRDGILSVAK